MMENLFILEDLDSGTSQKCKGEIFISTQRIIIAFKKKTNMALLGVFCCTVMNCIF